MTSASLVPLLLAEPELVRGAVIFVVTAAVLIAGGVSVAVVLLFRRRQGALPTAAAGLDTLTTRANILLVRADEAVAAGEAELGFALAQFGDERTAEFSATVAAARASLSTAFALRHKLDDAHPESAQREREWTLQIIATSERLIADLEQQDRDFSTLRVEELTSPERLSSLRATIAATEARLAPADETLAGLQREFASQLVAPLARAVTDATALLETAATAADAAEQRLSPSGVTSVAETLRSAEQAVRRANRLLDAVQSRQDELAAASVALGELVAQSRTDAADARERAAQAADPNSGAGVLAAIGTLESVASGVAREASGRNPVDELDRLHAAASSLDLALASARNQTERLAHARTALQGELVSATSQVSAARALIVERGRGGGSARRRLEEAERELEVARALADPVEALDAARRALTHARDADALARYRGRP